MDLREQITDAVYDHPRADDQINAVMGVVSAHMDTMAATIEQQRQRITELEQEAGAAIGTAGALQARVLELEIRERARDERIKELEADLEQQRDSIAARIVAEEQGVQQEITKEPLNSWLAGVLFGLQRARDITPDALERARENGGPQ